MVVVEKFDEIILLGVEGNASAACEDVVKGNLALLALGVSAHVAGGRELTENLVHHAFALVAQVGSVLTEEDAILG